MMVKGFAKQKGDIVFQGRHKSAIEGGERLLKIQPCLLNFTLVWITRTQTFVQEDASRFKQSYRYHHDPRGLCTRSGGC